jgi:hypothetical protein
MRTMLTNHNPQKTKCSQGALKNWFVVTVLQVPQDSDHRCYKCKLFALLNFRVYKNNHADKKNMLEFQEEIRRQFTSQHLFLAD